MVRQEQDKLPYDRSNVDEATETLELNNACLVKKNQEMDIKLSVATLQDHAKTILLIVSITISDKLRLQLFLNNYNLAY